MPEGLDGLNMANTGAKQKRSQQVRNLCRNRHEVDLASRPQGKKRIIIMHSTANANGKNLKFRRIALLKPPPQKCIGNLAGSCRCIGPSDAH